ncbi:unnamed protein product [Symbiodinium necroappetens]|uniref:Uncharacterized protein n=1 Tax=Symbiodinium necroappetens TaxID=1628268 RepID=A0A813CDC6_9DINO|nr:unnamed protein product [Symbiodinium necroappetens]
MRHQLEAFVVMHFNVAEFIRLPFLLRLMLYRTFQLALLMKLLLHTSKLSLEPAGVAGVAERWNPASASVFSPSVTPVHPLAWAMSLQSIWSCFTGLGSLSRSKQDTEEISFEDLPWQENLDQMINEVLLTEIARLRATFSQHLREHEVALSQLRSDGHARSCTRHDVELLRQQVQLMERHRRRRNFEVKKLRKAMKEVRNALFSETPPAAQGHLAAKQLLDEVRNERERRLAEKRYLEDQIKKLSDEVEEQQNAAPLVDHEKEKLKASVRQLKLSIESKDRYACWVCNRASHERQESGSDTEDSDRHEDECVMMRRRLVEMEEEIRLLTGGTAGSGLADFQSAAPSQASSQKPSARLSLEPPSIAESPLSLRPFRERVPLDVKCQHES